MLFWVGTIFPLIDTSAFGVTLGVGPARGVGVTFAAGVDGTFTFAPGFGFDFILVIRKENFAPWLALSHSIKLYDGK